MSSIHVVRKVVALAAIVMALWVGGVAEAGHDRSRPRFLMAYPQLADSPIEEAVRLFYEDDEIGVVFSIECWPSFVNIDVTATVKPYHGSQFTRRRQVYFDDETLVSTNYFHLGFLSPGLYEIWFTGKAGRLGTLKFGPVFIRVLDSSRSFAKESFKAGEKREDKKQVQP